MESFLGDSTIQGCGQNPMPGGGGHSLCREAPPERGTFVRLQVYERVKISLVEVYESVRKSVIWVCKRTKKGQQRHFMDLEEARKLVFVICVMT